MRASSADIRESWRELILAVKSFNLRGWQVEHADQITATASFVTGLWIEQYATASVPDRKRLVRSLVERAVVKKDTIDIHFSAPGLPFPSPPRSRPGTAART